MGDPNWLVVNVLPYLAEVDLQELKGAEEWLLAARAVSEWNEGAILPSEKNKVLSAIGAPVREKSPSGGVTRGGGGEGVQTNSAFRLAQFLAGGETSGLSAADEHAVIAGRIGLPADPRGSTPRDFLNLVKRQRATGPPFRSYLATGAVVRALPSKKKSLGSMASALRAWGAFCNEAEIPHFPVFPDWAAKFASVCRDYGTYRNYMAHLASACEFLSVPSEWAGSAQVRRAKEGLKRLALSKKRPVEGVSLGVISSIASVPGW